MEYRHLGRSGLKVSAISLGGWVTYGGHVGKQTAFDCMKAAFDAGINFFDCAEAYAGGESSKVMGEAIKHFGWKRNDLVVSTKIYWGSAHSDNDVNSRGLSRKHIVEGLNLELERLQLDYVDIVYAHRADRDTPMEETVRAFNHVIDQGKAFYWGTSEWNPEEIAAAWRVAEKLNLIGPVVEQPQYNLLARERVEKEYATLYEHYGTGLTIFSPLKVGILTGKYDSEIPSDSRLGQAKDQYNTGLKSRYGDEEWTKNLEQGKKLAPIAEKLGIDRATLAYAWVLKNPLVSSAITGASKVEQVHSAVESLSHLQKLTPEVMKEIDEALGNKPAGLTRRF